MAPLPLDFNEPRGNSQKSRPPKCFDDRMTGNGLEDVLTDLYQFLLCIGGQVTGYRLDEPVQDFMDDVTAVCRRWVGLQLV